ncbi:MAG: DUF2442 domain-containing protein [Candidatus Cloacimonetes bacterium HGW-Cloacimonetes-3]|nr:MAG: DUF2442 domain-containing protein [Candidatus Cloacimonetes bacterium HGW-Cloacimonetes-3]
MNKFIKVVPKDDFMLELTLSDLSKKTFDVKPFMNLGKFQELKDLDLFKKVRISFDSVEWPNGVDIDPELL